MFAKCKMIQIALRLIVPLYAVMLVMTGTSQDWAKGVAGVRYSYTVEMRDAGERGMILPAQQIVPTAEETWAGIYAASVELAHRLYDELPSCSPF
jgi:hypothetical protein